MHSNNRSDLATKNFEQKEYNKPEKKQSGDDRWLE
jgi:hypothetical protein